MPSGPRPPFDQWPIQHHGPLYGFAWYCGRGIIVSHIVLEHGSESAAHAYHDYEERALRDHADDFREYGGLFAIHDWRLMATYDGSARYVWQERMQRRPKGYLRGSVVCVRKAGALLRMAVQAVNLVASVSQGAQVRLSEHLELTLREHGLYPRPPDFAAR